MWGLAAFCPSDEKEGKRRENGVKETTSSTLLTDEKHSVNVCMSVCVSVFVSVYQNGCQSQYASVRVSVYVRAQACVNTSNSFLG